MMLSVQTVALRNSGIIFSRVSGVCNRVLGVCNRVLGVCMGQQSRQAFAFSREFEKLENRLLQSALQATPSHFCRSKPTSPSQVKEVVVKDASHP